MQPFLDTPMAAHDLVGALGREAAADQYCGPIHNQGLFNSAVDDRWNLRPTNNSF